MKYIMTWWYHGNPIQSAQNKNAQLVREADMGMSIAFLD